MEKLIYGRVYIGDTVMTKEQADFVKETDQLPDGFTEALILANALKASYTAHIADATSHNSADTTNTVSGADATEKVGLFALLNEMKAAYNAHCADATAHNSADTTNVITTPDATDLKTMAALANALKAAYNLHLAGVVSHNSADTTNVEASIDVYPWTQRYVTDEGAATSHKHEIKTVGNLILGITDVYTAGLASTVKVPFSESELKDYIRFGRIDPDAAETATIVDLKRNAGVKLPGVTVLVTDGVYGDETNIPSVDDPDAELYFNAKPGEGSSIEKTYDGNQLTYTVEFQGAPAYVSGEGAACGLRGRRGKFLPVT